MCVCVVDSRSDVEPGEVLVRQGGTEAKPAQHSEVHPADEQPKPEPDRLPSLWDLRGELFFFPGRLAGHMRERWPTCSNSACVCCHCDSAAEVVVFADAKLRTILSFLLY